MIHAALVALGCLLAQPATDGAAPTASLAAQVRREVRRLDAATQAERDAAEAKLIELGPEVLDLLPDPDKLNSAEAKERLGRVAERLQRSVAEQSLRPALITLQADAMPLGKVLEALSTQSGNQIIDARRKMGLEVSNPALKVSFDKTPFWQALDNVLDQAKLTVYAHGEGRAIHVLRRPEQESPRAARAVYVGPFRFEPVSVNLRQDLRAAELGGMQVAVEILWEPRIAPIGLRQPLAEVRATDDRDRPLAAQQPSGGLEALPAQDRIGTALNVPLKLPPRDAKEIARLDGRLETILPGRVETFRFPELARDKKQSKRIAGATVFMDGIRRNGDIWQVLMRVRFDEAGEALQSHRTWIYRNEAYLEDRDGKRVDNIGYDPLRHRDNELGLAYNFEVDPTGLTFVYKTPGLILTVGFDYSLKRIELP